MGEDPGYRDDFFADARRMNKSTAQGLTLTQWESELLFEVKTRQLKLLACGRTATRTKRRLPGKMGNLLRNAGGNGSGTGGGTVRHAAIRTDGVYQKD